MKMVNSKCGVGRKAAEASKNDGRNHLAVCSRPMGLAYRLLPRKNTPFRQYADLDDVMPSLAVKYRYRNDCYVYMRSGSQSCRELSFR
ncbi:hypothetical protein C0Q70_21687 [Pomacea canaliculata]|uniref:Uncharacterized protein n=1 Tax=Pomacea canaliculata TaxID=400727 RepID=A0A2T7ND75_POMCA|nr:hypothetical protein C0Q70_21687 [Pomacea canaliculata]